MRRNESKRTCFRYLDVAFAVLSRDFGVHSAALRLLGMYQVSPDLWQPSHELGIEKIDDCEYRISFDGRTIQLTMNPPGPTIGSLLKFLIVKLCDSFSFYHGSCCLRPNTNENSAAIFLAPSCHGKSTIALALAERGWKTLSDDFVPVSRTTGEVRPFLMPRSLRSGTLRLLGSKLQSYSCESSSSEPISPMCSPIRVSWLFGITNTMCSDGVRQLHRVDSQLLDEWCSLGELFQISELSSACTSHHFPHAADRVLFPAAPSIGSCPPIVMLKTLRKFSFPPRQSIPQFLKMASSSLAETRGYHLCLGDPRKTVELINKTVDDSRRL